MNLRVLPILCGFLGLSGCAVFKAKSPSQASKTNQSGAGATRPPQFIAMSFDGAGSIGLWKRWHNLDKKTGGKVKTTGLLSGVYLIGEESRHKYTAPVYGPGGALGVSGASDIGFMTTSPSDNMSGVPEYLTKLVEELNSLVADGHEMGTHLNGHFNANDWNAEQWKLELNQFNQLLENMPANNPPWNGQAIPSPVFKSKDIVGIRTPLLSGDPKVYQPILREFGYKYDSSGVGEMDRWPVNENGLWQMKLARIDLFGSGYRTLSMDFNFMVNQAEVFNETTGGRKMPVGSDMPDDWPDRNAQAEKFAEQMYKSYAKYFSNVYNGNRAPIHIGHHHALWNHGAYEQALYTFAAKVCTMPEVRCVTYKELTSFLEQNAANIPSWQAGSFPRLESNSDLVETLTADYRANKNNAYESPEIRNSANLVEDDHNHYVKDFDSHGE